MTRPTTRVVLDTTNILGRVRQDLDRIEMLSGNAASNAGEIATLSHHARALLNAIVIEIRI